MTNSFFISHVREMKSVVAEDDSVCHKMDIVGETTKKS